MSQFIGKEEAVSNLLRDGKKESKVIVTGCDKRGRESLKNVKLSATQRLNVPFLLLFIPTIL